MQTVNKNSGIKSRHVKIFDTTLRDGQQCPGAGMTFKQNLEYFRLASLLRVDVLEAGFPSASALDLKLCTPFAKKQKAPPIRQLLPLCAN